MTYYFLLFVFGFCDPETGLMVWYSLFFILWLIYVLSMTYRINVCGLLIVKNKIFFKLF